MTLTTQDERRFAAQVLDIDLETTCLIWGGHITSQGYGRFKAGGRFLKAHQVAWEIAHQSSIPQGMCVCHTCDRGPCVNPKHLWLGTQGDNMRDMHKKGRNALNGFRRRNDCSCNCCDH